MSRAARPATSEAKNFSVDRRWRKLSELVILATLRLFRLYQLFVLSQNLKSSGFNSLQFFSRFSRFVDIARQESSKNEQAKMSQRRTQVNRLRAGRNEKHRNSDDVSPRVARGNVLIQRRGPGYLGRDILYIPNSTVSLHRVRKKVSVRRRMYSWRSSKDLYRK